MSLRLSEIGLLERALIFSFCLFPLATLANTSKSSRTYNATSSERIAQKRTVGSGSRSNCQSLFEKKSLTLLVPPEQVVHYTTSSKPSFYLYAQASSTVPLIFNVVIPDPLANNPVVEEMALIIEQPGIIQIKLPAEVELEAERVYHWQIGIPCKNNPQQIDQVLKAPIKLVPLSAQLSNQLELADSPLKQAQIYASSGIWYDAFNLAIEQAQSTSESVDYVQQLGQDIEVNLEKGYLSSFKQIP